MPRHASARAPGSGALGDRIAYPVARRSVSRPGTDLLRVRCRARLGISPSTLGIHLKANGRAFVLRLNSGKVLYALQTLGYAELLDQAGNEEFDKHWA